MITHKFIDYLEYNCSKAFAPIYGNPKPIKGISNYKQGLLMYDGTRVYSGHNKSDLYKVVQSGVAMQENRRKIDDCDHLEWVVSRGADIIRLDMTMDIYISDSFITTEDFMEWYREGKIISSHVLMPDDTPRPPKVYAEVNEDGLTFETVNFGDKENRGKKGMVRVYDKGIELDLEKFMITRVEVEDKREKAHVSAKRILEHGIAPVLKSRFDVADDLYQAAIDASSIDITRGTQKQKEDNDTLINRWKWLIEIVAPTLGRSIAIDEALGNYGNSEKFQLEMFKAYQETIDALT